MVTPYKVARQVVVGVSRKQQQVLHPASTLQGFNPPVQPTHTPQYPILESIRAWPCTHNP